MYSYHSRAELQCSNYINEVLQFLERGGYYHYELYRYVEESQREYNILQAEQDEQNLIYNGAHEETNMIQNILETNIIINGEEYKVLSEDDTVESTENKAFIKTGKEGIMCKGRSSNTKQSTMYNSSFQTDLKSLYSQGRPLIVKPMSSVHNSSLHPYKKSLRICKFFLNGECRYGQAGNVGGICPYKHKTPLSRNMRAKKGKRLHNNGPRRHINRLNGNLGHSQRI